VLSSRNFFLAGGVISAGIAILHVVLTFKPEWWRYISGAVESPLAEMAERGSTGTRIASIALALIFAIWALYAFSGAGLIGSLPWQRTILIVIGAIYILRSLAIIPEINMVRSEGYSPRYVAFSIISLVAGLIYLIGVWRQE
jgi:hypothetical protein